MPNYVAYDSAASALGRWNRRLVNLRLLTLAKTSNRFNALVSATQSERRVDEALWDGFFKSVSIGPRKKIFERVRDWARQHILNGQACAHRTPMVHVKPRAALVDHIMRQPTSSGVVLPRSAAEDLVDGLTDPFKWKATTSRAADLGLQMSVPGRAVWSSFHPHNRRPYGALPDTADDIACVLGLDDGAGGRLAYRGDLPLLLLEFRPRGLPTHYPTMVEAWASESPNYYFEPAPRGARWGMTKPWPSAEPPLNRPRPEVVHGPTGLDGLSRVVKKVNR